MQEEDLDLIRDCAVTAKQHGLNGTARRLLALAERLQAKPVKDIEWYQEALESWRLSHERVTANYLQQRVHLVAANKIVQRWDDGLLTSEEAIEMLKKELGVSSIALVLFGAWHEITDGTENYYSLRPREYDYAITVVDGTTRYYYREKD